MLSLAWLAFGVVVLVCLLQTHRVSLLKQFQLQSLDRSLRGLLLFDQHHLTHPGGSSPNPHQCLTHPA